MKNQVCTEEQMLELRTLGVDISKASACLLNGIIFDFDPILEGVRMVRIFTVTDMLDRMPDKVLNGEIYLFQLLKGSKYQCRYYCIDYDISLIESYSISLRDAVYDVFKELAMSGKLINK